VKTVREVANGTVGGTVRLCYATLPQWYLRPLAVHCWFEVEVQPHATHHGSLWQRWEVWQDADAGGCSWGHLHRDLLRIGADVGGGASYCTMVFQGSLAHRLTKVLADTPSTYPYRHRYRPWPGPNSNTFVAWVLRQADILENCDGRAIGADFTQAWQCNRGPEGIGIQGPFIGFQLSATRIMLQLIGLRLGVSWRPWRLRTPVGDLDAHRYLHPQHCALTAVSGV
jgi:hypothetical protein